ncbi:MAG: hypothetical protein KDK62_05685 [Chlamydiia bacterium]|nr:hypothetical protein [Chlamydiia bacterium]
MKHINFERKLNKLEDALSFCAAFPLVGTVPAVVKVALGALQFLGGFTFVIGGSLYNVFADEEVELKHA